MGRMQVEEISATCFVLKLPTEEPVPVLCNPMFNVLLPISLSITVAK